MSYDAKIRSTTLCEEGFKIWWKIPLRSKFLEGEFKEGETVKIDANKKKDGVNFAKRRK